MTAAQQSIVTPRDVARVLFRHRRKIVLSFLGMVGLTLLVIAVYPRSYASESKLFIRVGRESVALDPTATTGQTIMLQKTQVDEVNSALGILDSREVKQRVAERVGVERIVKDLPPTDSASSESQGWVKHVGQATARARLWVGTALRSVRLSDPGTEVDRAVRRLDQRMRVWAPKQSTVISIRYVAASPELAHDVVEATKSVFLEEHLRLNRTEGSLEFFSEQTDKLRRELAEAQAELRDRKNTFQLASSESKRVILEEQIRNVESELLRTQRELAFSDAKIADLTRAIAGLEPELVTNRVAGFANEAKDGMREKLYELELQESELQSRYTAEHPLLVQIQKQRQQAEAILKGLPDDRTQTTAALNPNQRTLELDLLQVQATAEALQARLDAAQAQHGDLMAQVRALNDQDVQLSKLERDVDLLEGKYRMHVEKLEQARVNEAMGRERISNVKVAQPATLVRKPVWPNKLLFLAIGLILATGGSFGAAFLVESLDQTLRTTSQVEAELGLPVLLSFPYRKRRRRRAAGSSADRSSADSGGAPRERNGRYLRGGYRELVGELLSTAGNGARRAKTVGVVGCDASKLRSRVAAKLALQAACSDADSVLLIDADARRRWVARRFHLNRSPGWREVVAGVAEVESCIHRPKSGNLAVMAPGGGNGQTSAAKPAVGVLGQLDEIKNEYGLVVVDLPPAGELGGPPAVAEWLDETVLVVEAERTRIQAAQRVKRMLERRGVRLTGVVLANRREHIPRWLYQRL